MKIIKIGIRRRHLAALTFFPTPEKIEGAEYEGENILVDREILERCFLKENSEISDEELKELVLASECYRAKQRALWYLSGGEISEKGLFDKLNKNFSEKASAFAVSQMVSRGYVSDKRYAELLVRSLNSKNISYKWAVSKMLSKGISLELAKEVLADYGQENEQRVYNLLTTKYKNKMGDDDALRKTVASLVRKGFSYSEIQAALKKLV